ncbi:hypothetical protein [Lentzea jiangxiensis]|uniref:ABC-2 family transporter protein n=1 Tax=Lentzea jiangxiensis TaxID=641025 RepID=A0A1H0ETA8_9PSEU|nr:hypothetical protein [Lentzea jiangxiensis]SDN85556.1 hypothetical protein SAMN05421507_101509 [Lentzea jiangxiensis]
MRLESLAWLTWRQHRWSIAGVSAFALLATAALLSTETGQAGSLLMAGFYGLMAQLVFGGVVGVFWGAPLIARELEERTYFVAWGQDVTPVEWLRGKALVLGALAVALGALVGAGNGIGGREWAWAGFESSPLVQAGYAALGFALGVLIGLLSRHVVTAMAATLVGFTVLRVLLAVYVRDHYLPPKRLIATWGETATPPGGSVELGSGFVGADAEPVSVAEACLGVNADTCMRGKKFAIGTYVDYQPVDRIGLFQFFEFGVCALLAAGLLVLAFRVLRRGGTWKPSRSRRRITPEASVVVLTESAADGEDAQKATTTKAD